MNRSVTPEKLQKVLQENGHKINLDESKKTLDFMYKITKLVVYQIFKVDEDRRPLY
ncbi:hypothetical protein KZP23_04855 [Echinicola marina]|uniref:Uncharacterized protein n=1 Tax=Echinicola vietnamensis (strain DSM 17526 / LMG 23754 / KMM 6221) TaxID=926556 RepID=L0FYA3_ECHVK|nr:MULTISPECIES: hypothetical protein [Echinicola]AGA77615.1 hypothetical protein Echvi_1346 [Echinicola vietnamensis DSM 17526]UCS94363.1 hypothetical protein KZP23_04855 [Echinicola marina]